MSEYNSKTIAILEKIVEQQEKTINIQEESIAAQERTIASLERHNNDRIETIRLLNQAIAADAISIDILQKMAALYRRHQARRDDRSRRVVRK